MANVFAILKLRRFAKSGCLKWVVLFVTIFIIGIVILVTVISMMLQNASSLGTYGAGEVPPAVRQYEAPMKAELAKYGREDDINIVLAITSQESGGTASLDIMQASESLGLTPNTIRDPQKSIEVGVKYFDTVMNHAESAGVDVDTAIQSYNMGGGYIDFIAQNGGKHSKELAQKFSNQMKSQLGWSVYGDPNYVDNVKRYMGGATGSVGVIEDGILQNPFAHQKGKYITTSEFDPNRLDPVLGVTLSHNGIDLAPNGGANITVASAGDGVVTYAGFDGSAGNFVIVRHDNNILTRYLHLDSMAVKINQTVKKGDILGTAGTTGRSTGVHLHFEVLQGEGNPVNPRQYINF